MFMIEMAKQRHRSELSSSDGSVTRSKHKIGYGRRIISGAFQRTTVLRLLLSSACCIPFASNMAQRHGDMDR